MDVDPCLKPDAWGVGGSGGYPLGRRVKLRRLRDAPGPEISQIFEKNRIFRFEPGPRSARRAGFFENFPKKCQKGEIPGKPRKMPFWGGPQPLFHTEFRGSRRPRGGGVWGVPGRGVWGVPGRGGLGGLGGTPWAEGSSCDATGRRSLRWGHGI